MSDIYFNPVYGKMCELVDDGKCDRFDLQNEYGQIMTQFIKRPVPFLIDGIQYFDLVTPYGYGGPLVVWANDKTKLVNEYEKVFANYCVKNNIICEFIRYHPILKNYEDFGSVYQNSYSRHTVGTNLQDYDDPVQSEFSKRARREVRKVEKAGVTCIVNVNPTNLSVFRTLYEETMDRNHADAMYYFPDEYYRLLTNELRGSVLEIQAALGNEIIASEIYFITDGIMHAHLLGSNKSLLELGGGAILEAAAARWGKENGYRYIHHGGGRTSDENDPLYLYKKKFGENTEFDFYIGKRIWNQSIFDKAVEIRKAQGDIKNPDYFPLYRG